MLLTFASQSHDIFSMTFGTFIILLVALNVYAWNEKCPNLTSTCGCYNKERGTSDVECRGLCYKELQDVFSKSCGYKFDKFEIIASELAEVDKTFFYNVSVNRLEFRFCDAETFQLFKGLSPFKNLKTLVFDYVIVKRWIFTTADRNEFSQFRELVLLDCPEENINDTQIIHYLPNNVTSITINWCRMKSEGHSFHRFLNLQKLDLSHNELTSINRNFLPRPAKNLEFLSLSHNPISSLSDDISEGMPKLQTVYLESTSIATLPYDLFEPFITEVKPHHIAYNPLNCDCYNSWILTLQTSLRSKYFICVSPKTLELQTLDNITPKQMCQPEEESYQEVLHEYCSKKYPNASLAA